MTIERPARLLLGSMFLLLASGCMSREGAIRNYLVDAGISHSMADCMAEPLARELSDSELRKLAGLAKTVRADPRTMTYGDALRALETLEDPHLTRISVMTATGCALRP